MHSPLDSIPHIFGRMHAPVHRRMCIQHIRTHTRSHAPSIPQHSFCCFYHICKVDKLAKKKFIQTVHCTGRTCSAPIKHDAILIWSRFTHVSIPPLSAILHRHTCLRHTRTHTLPSDDVKLVLNNNSVPGYGHTHTHVHKDWKIFCRTQALLRE